MPLEPLLTFVSLEIAVEVRSTRQTQHMCSFRLSRGFLRSPATWAGSPPVSHGSVAIENSAYCDRSAPQRQQPVVSPADLDQAEATTGTWTGMSCLPRCWFVDKFRIRSPVSLYGWTHNRFSSQSRLGDRAWLLSFGPGNVPRLVFRLLQFRRSIDAGVRIAAIKPNCSFGVRTNSWIAGHRPSNWELLATCSCSTRRIRSIVRFSS